MDNIQCKQGFKTAHRPSIYTARVMYKINTGVHILNMYGHNQHYSIFQCMLSTLLTAVYRASIVVVISISTFNKIGWYVWHTL